MVRVRVKVRVRVRVRVWVRVRVGVRSVVGTPRKSHARPLKCALAGVSSAKRRRRKPR